MDSADLKAQTKKIQYLGSHAHQRAVDSDRPQHHSKSYAQRLENNQSPPLYTQYPTWQVSMPKRVSSHTSPSESPLLPPKRENKSLLSASPPPPIPEDLLKQSCGNLVTWLGGPYAVLLQIAAPGIALGSCTHSRFQTHPISRFRRTAAFIMAVVHGTEEQKALICGAIKKQHSFINGPSYTATDPELQKWTAATLFVAGQLTQDLLSVDQNPMPRAQKEVLCQQFGRFATALDMPAEMWPSSLEEFEAYFDEQIRTIEITEASKKVANILLREMELPWLLIWTLPVMRVLMAVWLPARIRMAFGLPDPRGWLVWAAYWVVVLSIWCANWLMSGRVKVVIVSWMKKDMARAAEDIRVHGRWMI
ncbi:hypothetical protein QBC40DRAFT_307949 [Triangularia verruculosa]|uniref:ER-bound oxygenase mpaB/mpaB'/Rubber oxygenase catalytic domain-containing protein n=1 Tax=Triangularia verruculosa TaxID=2587418 RepID=A0AAN7ATL4_9PEZI|nr:hypothetical protein QBC40DRAFT_307949 [Triangularia verruculosa]